jgi:hypothetical protein
VDIEGEGGALAYNRATQGLRIKSSAGTILEVGTVGVGGPLAPPRDTPFPLTWRGLDPTRPDPTGGANR